MSAVLLLCILGGLAIYFAIVRPLVVPLTRRIPHERKYWPGICQGGKR